MLERLIAIGGASLAAVSVSASDGSTIGIIAPIVVACSGASFARAMVIWGPRKGRRKTQWIFELAVTALTVLIAGTLATELHWSIGTAAMYGGGIGFIGEGLNSLLKNFALEALRSLASSILKVLPGGSDDTTQP
jgi:hypothetical protein